MKKGRKQNEKREREGTAGERRTGKERETKGKGERE